MSTNLLHKQGMYLFKATNISYQGHNREWVGEVADTLTSTPPTGTSLPLRLVLHMFSFMQLQATRGRIGRVGLFARRQYLGLAVTPCHLQMGLLRPQQPHLQKQLGKRDPNSRDYLQVRSHGGPRNILRSLRRQRNRLSLILARGRSLKPLRRGL